MTFSVGRAACLLFALLVPGVEPAAVSKELLNHELDLKHPTLSLSIGKELLGDEDEDTAGHVYRRQVWYTEEAGGHDHARIYQRDDFPASVADSISHDSLLLLSADKYDETSLGRRLLAEEEAVLMGRWSK